MNLKRPKLSVCWCAINARCWDGQQSAGTWSARSEFRAKTHTASPGMLVSSRSTHTHSSSGKCNLPPTADCWKPPSLLSLAGPVGSRCSIGKRFTAAPCAAQLRENLFSIFFFFFFLPLDRCCFLLPRLTVTEITAGGAVLLHQLALAVAIAFPSPGRADK